MILRNSRATPSFVLIGVLAACVLATLNGAVAARKVTVAVVRDGPTEMNEIVGQIGPELEHLTGSDFEVTFDTSDEYDAGWDKGRVVQVVNRALRNRNVDIVVGIGWLVSQYAARPDVELNKPFVSATLIDGRLSGLEYGKDRKLKDNLSLVLQPQRTDAEVELAYRLIRPERVHVVLDQATYESIPGYDDLLSAYGRELGFGLVPVPVADDWNQALEALGSDVDVVFFDSTPRLPRSERAAFVEALNERNIPTFSGVGPRDLEIGMLATNRRDMTQALVRRVALNIFQLLTGYSTGDLPVMLVSDTRLVINGKTAAKIGFSLTFEARVLGTLLHPEALESMADSLAVRTALTMADTGNIDLSISRQEAQTTMRVKQVDRSPLLPQLGVGADYLGVDNAFVGTFLPDQWARANLRLSQMVFDDRLISQFRSAGREYEAATYRTASDRLDVFQFVLSAYLSYVRSRLLYGISLENLRLTEGNLEIAKMRVDVGHSGRDEVYRWTAELNRQRTGVMDLESLVEMRRIALNRALGVSLGKRWRPQLIDENSYWFELIQDEFAFALESQVNFDRFTDATVDIAMEYSPERKFLLSNMEAEQIRMGQRKRSFIVPKVFLDLSYNYNFWQSPDQPELGDNFYEVRVTAELPLFEGTRRVYDVKLSESLLRELDRRLLLTDQLVEQRTREALRQIQASLPNIEYSTLAAENARKNFDVVRDQYTNGIVNITDLISAQTASFSADQDALIALYNFLQDVVDFQRAMSFFTDTKNPAEIDQFVEQVRQRMNSQETP